MKKILNRISKTADNIAMWITWQIGKIFYQVCLVPFGRGLQKIVTGGVSPEEKK